MRIPLRMFLSGKPFRLTGRYRARGAGAVPAAGSDVARRLPERRTVSFLDADRTGVADRAA